MLLRHGSDMTIIPGSCTAVISILFKKRKLK